MQTLLITMVREAAEMSLNQWKQIMHTYAVITWKHVNINVSLWINAGVAYIASCVYS